MYKMLGKYGYKTTSAGDDGMWMGWEDGIVPYGNQDKMGGGMA